MRGCSPKKGREPAPAPNPKIEKSPSAGVKRTSSAPRLSSQVARIVGELLVTMGAIKRPTDGTSGPASIVKEVSRADLVGEHVGSTALKARPDLGGSSGFC